MPLPQPSKMTSKRFKKPKPFLTPSSQLPLHHHNLVPDIPPRKWRVRVVCTDPDATDDSSADELDSSPSPNRPRKRLIHEIFLPQPSMPQSMLERRKRQSSNSGLISRSRKLRSNYCDTEEILQDMGALLDATSGICIGSMHAASPYNYATMPPNAECTAAEEEFARFLSEFVPENGGDRMWDDVIDRSGVRRQEEDGITDMLNLELDSEALTWINSLQRLP